MAALDEIELARQVVAGSAGAFERFAEHFRAKIFRYSWLMCGHREDAEEVAQETLLRVFESFDALREPEHVRAWVFQIARNACRMKHRKSAFAPQNELSLDEFLPAREGEGGNMRIEIADWSRMPDDALLRREMNEVLHIALRELPERHRSAILLRDLEELSTQETARILDVGEAVVKTRLHPARLAIRQKVDAHLRVAQAVI